jgi:7-cyano-7-deazaguanine synthase
VEWSKTRIVHEALRLGVPIARTWSCYSGGSSPCGLCDSCRIRDGALVEAGRADLTSAALGNRSAAELDAVETQRAPEP